MSQSDLRRLSNLFILDALNVVECPEGFTPSEAILKAIREALVPQVQKEIVAATQKYANELTFDSAEDVLSHAMGEFWDSTDMDEFQDAMHVRFPKHKKAINRLMEWAGDNSNEREEMGRNGPSAAFEKTYDKVMRALRKLPW